MEAKKTTFESRTPEEVRAWFYRAKARMAAREEDIRAMYKEEQRMKAERKHVYDLESVQVMNKLRNHPQADDVIAWFDHDTQMFDSMKP